MRKGAVVVLALFSTGATAWAQAAGSSYQQTNPQGIVSMEAENAQGNVSQGSRTWTSTTAFAGFSGSAAMQALPDSGTNNNLPGVETASPRLDFSVNFISTGTHYVWIFGRGPDDNPAGTLGAGDSIHAGIDGAVSASAARISGWGATYSWQHMTMDPVIATINVTSLGVHTVSLWMREDGFIVDKWLLTTDAAYTPTGTGPAESPVIAAPVLTGTNGVNRVSLSWGTVNGATSYVVLRSTTQGSGYQPLPGGTPTGTTYVDLTAANPNVYYYVVAAVTASGTGPYSNEVTGTPQAPKILVSPTSLAVAENGGTAFFTVTLVTNPTANVTVPITSANAGALTLTAPGGAAQGSINLLFTPGGALSQQVMVTGVERFSGTPLTVLVNFGTVTSTDGNYSGANYMPSVSCVISPDAAGIVVLPPSGLATVNGGSPIQFTVQLATNPQGTVVLNLSVSDPNLATVGPQQITTASPSVAVTVTVTPLSADPQTTYIGPYDIIIDSSPSTDPAYAALGQTLVPIDTPVSRPPLTKVWNCGLTGLEGMALLGVLAAWRRKRRRKA